MKQMAASSGGRYHLFSAAMVICKKNWLHTVVPKDFGLKPNHLKYMNLTFESDIYFVKHTFQAKLYLKKMHHV